ncbi:hypothetical protein JCM13991_13460 [Thermodesulfovibrio hydrogeniphilus]
MTDKKSVRLAMKNKNNREARNDGKNKHRGCNNRLTKALYKNCPI